jgi:hypothetical protein
MYFSESSKLDLDYFYLLDLERPFDSIIILVISMLPYA